MFYYHVIPINNLCEIMLYVNAISNNLVTNEQNLQISFKNQLQKNLIS